LGDIKTLVLKIKNLKCEYDFSKKAWINSELLTRWLTKWNSRLRASNRKIILILDNAGAHAVDEIQFPQIKLLFLPPNLTSHLQPLDAGIIRAFKAHYRKRMVKYLLQGAEEKNELPVVNIKHAIDFTAAAWDQISSDTIKNCWRHTHIYPSAEEGILVMNHIDSLLADLQKDLNALSINVSANDFVSVDDNEPVEGELSNEMLIESVLPSNDQKEEEAESEDENEPVIISNITASQYLEGLISWFEQSVPDSLSIIQTLHSFNAHIENKRFATMKQSNITQYFSK
jgi:hypothetical protein